LAFRFQKGVPQNLSLPKKNINQNLGEWMNLVDLNKMKISELTTLAKKYKIEGIR